MEFSREVRFDFIFVKQSYHTLSLENHLYFSPALSKNKLQFNVKKYVFFIDRGKNVL